MADEKLRMGTAGLAGGNIEKIRDLFPGCVTEAARGGKTSLAVDFDALRLELGCNVVEGPTERYQFTWPDKSKAKVLANSPTNMTLRPCRKESVDFDSTKNLYIEGDNLEVLKILRETYLGKIKMIYIDPPYNTGNDFVYNDDFSISQETYSSDSGQFDDEGNRLVLNTEANGRFHTDWLNMIYPRLKLAKDFLSEDGVIFVSIDDCEEVNLVKMMDEIFGAGNHIGTVIWERAFAPKNDAKFFSASHDYIVVYSKRIDSFAVGKLSRTAEANARYKNPDNDPKGPWMSSDLTAKTYSAAYDYPITTPSGKIISPTNGRCWFTSRERMQEMIKEGRIWFGEDGGNTPRLKRYLADVQQGMTPTTLWKFDDVGHNQEGRQELKKVFDGKGYFDGPKPVRLIRRILTVANLNKDSIIMDFFSGSATTAHAVFEMNEDENKECSFIMVQLPEKLKQSSDAYRDGYRTICDIGKERIRKVGANIQNRASLNKFTKKSDFGFKVLKLDSSNMKDVFYSPSETRRSDLDRYLDSIKEDRSGEDLLFQVMLELGIEPSASISDEKVDGKEVYSVDGGYLIACFDRGIDDSVMTQIAKRKPYYFVMRDESMLDDSVAVNFDQIFRAYSPDTVRKVLRGGTAWSSSSRCSSTRPTPSTASSGSSTASAAPIRRGTGSTAGRTSSRRSTASATSMPRTGTRRSP